MSDDWPQIKVRLEELVRLMPGESSTQSSRDIRAALQRVNDLDNACMVHHDEYAALRQRVEELERYNIEHTKLMYAARCRAEAAEAKVVNSEEGHRWLEAQLREAEAKLAKVVKAGEQICEFAVGWEPLTPGDISEFRAALAAAKGE